MAEILSQTGSSIRVNRNGDALMGVGVVGVLLLMILPVPNLLLDLLLAFSISSALVILFVALHTVRPVEFSAFPSILLLITLFRLSLNIATTRAILLNGNTGDAAAGEVIRTFGNLVIGGNYAVGLVVFIILVVINFVVITKGAGRIAEVAARFMLDAMPGKQMSIDADLNAGVIDEKEARQRREAISKEADFYGAMDGASKFVRGDAIAAIVIILVNIVGGLVIGVLQQGMDIVNAAQNYTLLSIGDGLVGQIPGLIISTAAGIVVSRAAGDSNLGSDVTRQMIVHPRALIGASLVILLFSFIPGMPHLAFLCLAGGIGYIGYTALQAEEKAKAVEVEPEVGPVTKPEDEEWLVPLDLMELNVGYGLIPLVDQAQGGELLKRIAAIRKQLALELGFVVPPIHIRDNLQIKPNEYSIVVKGIEISRGEVFPNYFLAMNPTNSGKSGFEGIETHEPCFGLPALWITEEVKERAQVEGFTVVDVPSVIATHLTETVRNCAHELLGRQEVQQLLDKFGRENPKVIEELIPNLLPLGGVVKVLGNLLKERVTIRDIRSILETLADYAGATKDPDQLTAYCRQTLARSITKQYQNPDGNLMVISIDPRLDQRIAEAIHPKGQEETMAIDPLLSQSIIAQIRRASEQVAKGGHQPVILCSPVIRIHLRRMAERFIPNLVVLSSNEISPQVKLQSIETVRLSGAD
ncbi:flagellar biosynthesis protein FlhA [Nitrospira defluvii]|nr:flagellar biosynthesis protein FlhA [Nitrospira defluvii]